MTGPYDDIIGMEHHVSQRHPRMGRLDRAAQFSPFAALSGYEEAIEEAARLTERRPILSEDARAALDEALSSAVQGDEVSITYFREDSRKSGGSCITVRVRICRIDSASRLIMLSGGISVPFGDVLDIRQ